MPDANGWHNRPVTTADGRNLGVWHYCPADPEDTLVEDTLAARRAHEIECARHVRAREKARRAEARRRSLEGLRAAREERRLRGAA